MKQTNFGWKKGRAPFKKSSFWLSFSLRPIIFSPPFTVCRIDSCGKNCAFYFCYQIFWKEVDIWYYAISDIYYLLVFLLSISNQIKGQIALNFPCFVRNATCTRILETFSLDYSIMWLTVLYSFQFLSLDPLISMTRTKD